MLPGLQPYRMDIQQGNVVTQEMVAKLKPGMTRQQVRFVMGTPPIADTFHQDRWDYVYYLNKGGRVVEHRRIVLLFDGDTLKRIEGELANHVAEGFYTAELAAEVRAEGERVIDSIRRLEHECVRWSHWSPARDWTIPPFIDGWDTTPPTFWDRRAWAYGVDRL